MPGLTGDARGWLATLAAVGALLLVPTVEATAAAPAPVAAWTADLAQDSQPEDTLPSRAHPGPAPAGSPPPAPALSVGAALRPGHGGTGTSRPVGPVASRAPPFPAVVPPTAVPACAGSRPACPREESDEMSQDVSPEALESLVAELVRETRLAVLRHRHAPEGAAGLGLRALARDGAARVAGGLRTLPAEARLPAALHVIELLWGEDLRLLRDYGGLNGETRPRLARGPDFV